MFGFNWPTLKVYIYVASFVFVHTGNIPPECLSHYAHPVAALRMKRDITSKAASKSLLRNHESLHSRLPSRSEMIHHLVPFPESSKRGSSHEFVG